MNNAETTSALLLQDEHVPLQTQTLIASKRATSSLSSGPTGHGSGSAGETFPTVVSLALPHSHGVLVSNSTSSNVMVHGFPLRQSIAPGAMTVPFKRRKVKFL